MALRHPCCFPQLGQVQPKEITSNMPIRGWNITQRFILGACTWKDGHSWLRKNRTKLTLIAWYTTSTLQNVIIWYFVLHILYFNNYIFSRSTWRAAWRWRISVETCRSKSYVITVERRLSERQSSEKAISEPTFYSLCVQTTKNQRLLTQ